MRHGYVEAIASVSSLTGAELRAEAGYRPAANLGLFGFASWAPSESMAGVGARLEF